MHALQLGWRRGERNNPFEKIKSRDCITISDIYASYPTYDFPSALRKGAPSEGDPVSVTRFLFCDKAVIWFSIQYI